MSGVARLRAAIAAALILAIGMGFGRFAFTAIYPHMVEEGALSLRDGSLAASANYAGYLLGAILAMRARAPGAHRLCLWSVGGTALCLGVLALPMPVWLFVAVRCAPLLYAGVGAGIAVSAELLVLASQLGWHSAGMWLLLAGVTVLAGLAAAPAMAAGGQAPHATPPQAAAPALASVAPWPLVLIYGLAGLGYIVTATYLPVLVGAALPGLNSAHVWAVFGLGAAPSCFLWHRLHERLGTRRALRLNLLLQALGVVLPVLAPSAAAYLLSAILVGGTFVGTVTIAMPAAQRAAAKAGTNMMAIMTVVYGVGQIIGPVLAGSLYAQSHSFNSALLAAAGALLLAIAVSLRL